MLITVSEEIKNYDSGPFTIDKKHCLVFEKYVKQKLKS